MRTRVLFVGGLLLALLAATLTGAAAARTNATSAKATPKAIDLATYPAKRWIVMLDKQPLARYSRAKRGLSLAGGNPAKLNLAAAVNRTYLRGLARNHSAFKSSADTGREGLPRRALVQSDAQRPRAPDESGAGRQVRA